MALSVKRIRELIAALREPGQQAEQALILLEREMLDDLAGKEPATGGNSHAPGPSAQEPDADGQRI